jgi:ribonuclease Z
LPRKYHAPERSTAICCYAFHTPAVRGKFEKQKAVALGVPPGPLYGKLIQGESVPSKSGAIVRPEDVLTPDQPGSIVIVIKCPREDYLESLVTNPAWKAYQQGEFSRYVVVVVHISPPEVLLLDQYQNWKSGFGAHAFSFEFRLC